MHDVLRSKENFGAIDVKSDKTYLWRRIEGQQDELVSLSQKVDRLTEELIFYKTENEKLRSRLATELSRETPRREALLKEAYRQIEGLMKERDHLTQCCESWDRSERTSRGHVVRLKLECSRWLAFSTAVQSHMSTLLHNQLERTEALFSVVREQIPGIAMRCESNLGEKDQLGSVVDKNRQLENEMAVFEEIVVTQLMEQRLSIERLQQENCRLVEVVKAVGDRCTAAADQLAAILPPM